MLNCAFTTRRTAGWLQACGILLIGIALGLTWFAVLFVFFREWPGASPLVGIGFLGYALGAGAASLFLHWLFRAHGTKRLLPLLMGASLALQIGVIASTSPEWTGPKDAELFRYFLDRLAEGGYTPEALSELSAFYDYSLWTRRAVPVHLLLRIWSGSDFLRVIQVSQAVLLTLMLALTWRIASLLFGRKVAAWACIFQFIMPQQWIACLDVNHHITGIFYFASSLWVIAEWCRPPAPKGWRLLGLALGAGLLLPLMRLAGSMDKVYLAAVFLVLLLRLLGGKIKMSNFIRGGIVLLVIPYLAGVIWVSPLNRRIEAANTQRLASPLGFIGSGWALESGGEFSEACVQMDVLTPIGEKTSKLGSLLASHAAYHPEKIVFRLFPTKIIKFFLLGYASSAEETLRLNGRAGMADLAQGARNAFLLGLLPLMSWGALLLMPLLGKMTRLHLILPCVLYTGGVIALWEISPRYSGYVQPFLFMLAALPLAWALRRRQLLRKAVFPALVAAALVTVVLLAAIAAFVVAQPWIQKHAFEDVRLWAAEQRDEASVPPALAPFEMQLLPSNTLPDPGWGPVHLPPAPDQPGRLCFYALKDRMASWQRTDIQLVTEYTSPAGRHAVTNPFPGYVAIAYHPGPPGTLSWRTIPAQPGALRIGYASYVLANP